MPLPGDGRRPDATDFDRRNVGSASSCGFSSRHQKTLNFFYH